MNTSSAFIVTAFGLILVVLIIIPLSTDHWEDYESLTENATDPTSVGLWRFCRRNGCVHFSGKDLSADRCNKLKSSRVGYNKTGLFA